MHTDRPANWLKPNSPSLQQTQCASYISSATSSSEREANAKAKSAYDASPEGKAEEAKKAEAVDKAKTARRANGARNAGTNRIAQTNREAKVARERKAAHQALLKRLTDLNPPEG